MIALKIYSCKIPGDLRIVSCTVKDIIRHLMEVYGTVEDATLFELKVILNELVSNAIKHGNKGDSSKFVKIIVGLTEKGNAVVLIEDSGKGFDYRYFMEEDNSTCDMTDMCCIKETGRGILIVKSLSDKMKFNRKGNKVIIAKKLYRG